MFNRLLISIALATAMGTAASAATVSFTSSFAPQLTGFTDEALGVQQFDSSLGTLTGATISLTGIVNGTAFYQNLGNTTSNINLTFNGMITLKNPSGTPLVVALPIISEDINGIAPGASGSVPSLSSSDTQGSAIAASEFGAFTGNGFINLLLSSAGNSVATGPSNFVGGFLTDAGASVTVTYTYDDAPAPVPLPAGMPLLLLGIGAMGLAAKRRKA